MPKSLFIFILLFLLPNCKKKCNAFEAQVAEGFATINIYLQHPVGIGEHPQHLDEVDKLLGQIKEAEEKMSLIKIGQQWVNLEKKPHKKKM